MSWSLVERAPDKPQPMGSVKNSPDAPSAGVQQSAQNRRNQRAPALAARVFGFLLIAPFTAAAHLETASTHPTHVRSAC